MCLLEPDEEFDGLGDFLLGGTLRAVGGLAGSRFTAEPAKVVPRCELFDWGGADRGGVDCIEFVGEPNLEARQVFIAWWQQSVVLQQATKVVDMAAGPCCGEPVMRQWYGAAGDSTE